MKSNPIVLEMLMQRFRSVAEEMAYSLQRTGYTAFVNETADLGVALATPEGEIFGYPSGIGITMFSNLDLSGAIRAFEGFEPGDIIITNDPYNSGGMASHLPDVNVLCPVFHEGELVCFAFAYVHSTDVGGIVPGSLSPTSAEVFQEGIRIPPLKLYRKGELNEDVLKLILNNCRIPADNRGDLRAMITALKTGESRTLELIGRYGREAFVHAMRDALDYSERRARAAIEGIPEGCYRFHDYLDSDVATEVPVRLQVAITVKAGGIHVDYSGTDPQLKAAFNLYSAGKPHPWLVYKLMSVLLTLDPGIPVNAGLLRPVTTSAPEGSVVNAVFPAAVGLRTTMGVRLQDALMGALAQALPEIIPAAGAGTIVPVVFAEPGAGGRGVKVNVLETLSGGTGGTSRCDGQHARDVVDIANLRNNPLEMLEARASARVLRYGLAPDSGGAGRFRGGCGTVLEFEVLAPDCSIIARGMERQRFRSWGLLGGGCGGKGSIAIRRARAADFETPGKQDVLRVSMGDRVRIVTAGGGGYGEPFEREPQRVFDDVMNGFASVAGAERDYGVVISGGRLDLEATTKRRAGRAAGAKPQLYSLGQAREDYERVWTPELWLKFIERLFALPPAMRYECRLKVWRAMEQRRSRGETVDAAALEQACAEVAGRLSLVASPAGGKLAA
ncbi:MAG TPA: hydantoinase B/oxoprolinase family protein [Burkholderiales bacterium]|nr:hydantoinase B/oxoprolinase family protein [Burkholderiales bacterium]